MFLTEDYKKLQKQLHAEAPHYGVSGARYVDIVRPLAKWGRLPILDYGAGKCMLAKFLGPAFRVTNYDPCIDGLDTPPEPHPVVVCTDVLEHVEPEFIEPTLAELRRLTMDTAFLVISVEPAQKILADGRNAHISLHPFAWWEDRVKAAGFAIIEKYDDNENCSSFGLTCR